MINDIVDPIIGERHVFYLKPWKEAATEFIGVWSHLSKTPDRPVQVFEDGGKAFDYAFRMNRMHRLARKAGL